MSQSGSTIHVAVDNGMVALVDLDHAEVKLLTPVDAFYHAKAILRAVQEADDLNKERKGV